MYKGQLFQTSMAIIYLLYFVNGAALATVFLQIFLIFRYPHLYDSCPVDKDKIQKCFLRFSSFWCPLLADGGQCDSLRVDRGMYGNVTESNVALNVSYLSLIDPFALSDYSFEILQFLIFGMLTRQMLG